MAQSDAYIYATYRVVDKPNQLQARADGIAIGLTVGSWTDLPQSKQDSVRQHCGIVASIEEVDAGARPDGTVTADITIGYPVINFTPTFAALLTTVFGKLSMDGLIKLVGLQIPEPFARAFPGPKFGVNGIRDRLKVYNRPLLMSIFKSCIGNNLDELTAHFTEQALGGADLIKDDEIFFTEAYATPEARVEAYTKAMERTRRETGKDVLYAVNLTGPVFELRDRARRLSDLGAGALLLNVFAYGLDVLRELAADPDIQVPIMAHPAVSGALYAAPQHGIAADILLGQLLRLGGADIVIYPSPYGSVTLERTVGQQLVSALRTPGPHNVCLPAPSAGIHPGLVPILLQDMGVDFIVNAGGGIHGHPDGATAGGQAFTAAIDAALAGVPLAEAANHSEPLRKALLRWGEAK
ncbi:2,3-diketo-5-methylthiopentyl-1-phosphate enolase [Alicyclobacillus cycloheptanicus]|uniref:2,3-diketo-5-methylthiopentyl-1-phosphate enolase n=1 Tax=Alicyclobacillus cycloheptanicus TaxID=1457 RepID=A0ABT9XHM3_9BACL|nr:2,3-diketo-5-methylthiopentyl-1-phosphate enolase [Alicyclobacillus cycloheptanicus]MDQ0189795.1 2,3-diketo-5-methylthiopentyl-1-phosphate enolase [Alicyclobacillus cycloheptanicus]